MKKLVILLVLLLVLLPASLVFAIADPDSPPAVNAVYVYDNLLEPGDAGVLVDYYLDYAVLPTEIATEAYLVVFVDTDGTTQLRAVAPYAFVDSGYGRGLVWIHFTAAEVATYGIDSADQALYKVWLTGNPTIPSGWAGDPPKTIAGIDQWTTVDDPSTLLALRVLYYADQLEIIWSLDMIEITALGNRLTSVGESYFENVMPNLRIMAPAAFAAGEEAPDIEDIDYTISFGATATGAIVSGSPVTLVEGSNTLTVTATGTFVLDLNHGTRGTITNGTATISSSPSDLIAGENEITVTGGTPGTLIVDVELTGLQSQIDEGIEGTGWDLTTIAAVFGMSRAWFSGILWLFLTVLICAATYATGGNVLFGGANPGKTVMLTFGVCMIIGVLLGLLSALPAALLFICYGAYTGYILFFRTSAEIGRTVMFMGYMWIVTCLAGGIVSGVAPQASTRLTADISATDTTIPVVSTVGFKCPGTIVIDGERIAYSHLTATTIGGTFWRPLIRGTGDVEATTHQEGAIVRMPESSLINDALSYNIALLSDASGLMSFITVPLALLNLIGSFMILPLSFLGTDLVILTIIWGVIAVGLLVSLWVALAGGRRV